MFVIVFLWFLDACVRRRPAGGVKVERPHGRTTLTAARSGAGCGGRGIIPAGSADAPAYLAELVTEIRHLDRRIATATTEINTAVADSTSILTQLRGIGDLTA